MEFTGLQKELSLILTSTNPDGLHSVRVGQGGKKELKTFNR